MKLTYNDIASARMWAEAHCGEDQPIDLFEHKLLELVAQSHDENAGYHERSAKEARKLMAEIEERFKVEDFSEF